MVGSGYGGGITASRAGRQVCVLERGREFQPGEYPDRAWASRRVENGRPGHGTNEVLDDQHMAILTAGTHIAIVEWSGGARLLSREVARRRSISIDADMPSADRTAQPLAPGTILGRYEIAAAIGAGGMGEVYRARDGRLGREVAIKVLPPLLSKLAGMPHNRC